MKNRFVVMILSLMLCVSMLSSVFAETLAEGKTGATEVLNLPETLQVIRAEAFEHTSSVKTVVVPEGAKRIEARAFADSAVREIYLPASIEFIADDAFEGCEELIAYVPRGSAAHEYFHDSDVSYSIIEPETGDDEVYAIHSVVYMEETDENGAVIDSFLATVDTTEACDVQVLLIDEEDGDVLLAFDGSAEANLRHGKASATMDGEFALPQYYILEANLIGADGEVLCTYTSHKYTARHEAIDNKTAADYTGEVVTFGSAGYGVLEEGVVRVDGVQSGGGYIVSRDGISEGDVLLVNVGSKNKAVKVKSFTDNGDGTITVQPDDNIEMGEVYQRLDIDGYMQAVDGIAPAYVDDGEMTIIPVNPSFKMGPLSMSGELKFFVKAKFVYDKKEKYFFTECLIGHSGEIEVGLTGAFNTRDLDDRLGPVLFDKGIEVPNTDLEAKLVISLPIDVDVSAGGTAHISYESKSGFTYNSDDKIFEKIDEDSSEAYAKVEGDLNVTAGPEIMLRMQLLDWLEAKIWGQIGIEIDGEVKGLQYGGSVSTSGKPDEVHACDACLDCDINIFAGIWGSLECTALKELSVKLMDNEILAARAKVGDAFYSFVNDVESPYGGEPEFGFGFIGSGEGECRNKKYRADISTVDYSDTTVTEIPITSTGVYGTVQNGTSPCSMYLYPGSNAFTAQFENSLVSTSKTMPEKAAALTIKEPAVNITVHVLDESTEEPISGAQVSLIMPNNSTKTGVTDAKGVYTFEKLPQGNYSFVFFKDGYESKEVNDRNYAAGTNGSMTVYMHCNELPVLTAYTASAGTIQALASDGTCPPGVPRVTITVSEDDYGFLGDVVVRHENCENALRYSATYTGYVDFFGVDMGNGEYTYILGLGNAGTGGGCDIVVFREVNGILETFDLSLDDIDVEGTFTNDTRFSATILPSNTSISGTMPLPYDGFKRKGHDLSPMGSGYMEYAKNENGAYDLIYSLRVASGGYNWDNIGSCKTRFVMENNIPVMDSQWFEMYEGGTLD